jgi:hypothetical protein
MFGSDPLDDDPMDSTTAAIIHRSRTLRTLRTARTARRSVAGVLAAAVLTVTATAC